MSAEMDGFDRLALPDEVYAFSDLREDFAYQKIPPERRGYYISRALQLGRQAAADYQGKDLCALLRADGVTLRRVTEPSPIGLHAQIWYDGPHRQVDLFTDTAQKLSRALADTPLPLTPQQAEELFLAHEFYHWLEYAAGVPTDARCDPVETRVLGLFRREIRVRRTGEIAAFAFAGAWCQLPLHPKALDYWLLYQEEGAERLNLALDALSREYQQQVRVDTQERSEPWNKP
jgi:hypothetical protein